jgi:single-strand DNA-binding protein
MSGFIINTVTLSGNLTRDPELRSTGSGVSVCGLRIASNERYKDSAGEWSDRPGYYDITIWKGLGEWVASNVHKGDQIVVEGRLHWREWETDGQKRQAIDITANSIIPVPRGNGGGGTSRREDLDVPFDTSGLPPVDAPTPVLPGGDDIPFVREPDRYEFDLWHGHENR